MSYNAEAQRRYRASEKGQATVAAQPSQTPERRRARARKHYALYPERNNARSRGHQHAKRAFLRAYKLERGCVDCGYAGHPAALEFDHLPGSKKVAAVGSMVSRSWAVIYAEIEKCEVVCANCHAVRTADRRLECVQ